MAIKPPPPPTKSEPGSFAWMDWYRSLYDFITTAGAISWSQISFAGSKLTDIATRLHSNLQGVLGNGQYHLSAAEQARIGNLDLGYGYFYDTTTQTAAAINTAYAITYNTTSLSRDVSLGTPTSRIIVAKAGVYSFHFSIEADKVAGSAADMFVWGRKNGVDIANSGTKFTLAGSITDGVLSWNLMVTMAANDYFELMWSVASTAIQLEAYTAVAPVPAIPSIIMTVNQVSI